MSWWRKLVRPTFQLPPNQVIYAIGDIHGRLDLLKEMHALIVEDAKKYEGRDLMIVYLGDYVDRGPDVSGVLDVLVNGPPDGFTGVYIKGNHEQMLLDFLSDARVGQAWFDAAIGGFATIESYGVAFPKYVTELDPVQAELKAKLPDYHLEFLQDLPTHFECGDYYFVHAGIHPNRPLAAQREEDLIWIREPFLSSHKNYGKRIVHGHTISAKPVVTTNRIGVDTGAYWSGVLTCVALHKDKYYFLKT